jgi:hypothetical protein
LLAFKASILKGLEERRRKEGDSGPQHEELVLRFIETGAEARATARRVEVAIS